MERFITNGNTRIWTISRGKGPNLLRDIARIRVPAIFINAGNDIRPNWPTQQLAALIPQGKYLEIEGAAHMIWLTHEEELREVLRVEVKKMI